MATRFKIRTEKDISEQDLINIHNTSNINTGDQSSSDFNLEDLGDVIKTGKSEGKILKVNSEGKHIYVTDESGTDEKVKYDASDPTAGYMADKVIAGTGISVAEGTGANESKLVITNDDKGSDVVVPVEGDFDIKNLADSDNLRTTWSAKQDALTAGVDYEVPLTFSTGLTRTTDTITCDITQYTDSDAISAIQGDASWNATNWDTAYSWGDHALAGYVTGTPWTSEGYLTNITGESIADLSDVDSITGITDGKILKWSTNKFVLADDEDTTYTASDFDIKDLTDSTNLMTSWNAKYDSTNFVAGTDYEDALGNPASDDYVLSSKTDGTRSWVEMSGGGGDPDYPCLRPASWTAPYTIPGWIVLNQVLQASATHLYYTPIFCNETMTFDKLIINVTSASSAGGLARMGIYNSDADGYPSSLVVDAGTVAIDSTGTKTITIADPYIVLTRGLYFIAWVGDVSATYRAPDTAASAFPVGGYRVNSSSMTMNGYELMMTANQSALVASGLPATASGTFTPEACSRSIVMLRRRVV